jgi:hypothetical protein
LNYRRDQYTKGPRGFIIYPDKENLIIPTKEEAEAKVKNKQATDQRTQLERYKLEHKKALNCLIIQYNGKEAFWSELEKDAKDYIK